MILYTKKEAADVLRVGVRTLERMIQTGEIEAYRVKGSIRVSDKHIEDYLVMHRVKVHVQTPVQTSGRKRKKQTERLQYVPGMKVV